MQPSMFNVRVPLDAAAGGSDVFLMNTFSDAQLIVSRDVAALLDRIGSEESAFDADERDAIETLAEHGFVVPDRGSERVRLEDFFRSVREDDSQLRVTVLTTLQCNFACDYCIQGDHGDYNKHATKMSLDTAARVAQWCEERLDAVAPGTFVVTFFGGEPLLNLPVVYYLAEQLSSACAARGVRMLINIITNGLLLTPEVVDRLAPFGLNGVKITLDGDRDTHNRMRPLRGGQGTFDRILDNIRKVADKCRISIGGNFDADSVDSYPALLDFLREQEFADKLAKVNFKPIITAVQHGSTPTTVQHGATPTTVQHGSTPTAVQHGSTRGAKKFLPLTPVGGTSKPLNGTCMTTAGGGTSSACDSCHFVDEKMAFLREETMKRGFPTVDGVHMGPCEIHRRHAHTIGPDGSLYACPGFAGEATSATGHINGMRDALRSRAAEQFERLAAWQACNDCAFIPVCAGGCTVAAHAELQDMHAPNCHKTSFEAGLVTLAREAYQASLVTA
jgi:uncharacterized protein